jgi:hypothetical protein
VSLIDGLFAARAAVAKSGRRRYASARRIAMLQVGQEVVLMSFPGRFRIVAVDGDVITIENDVGIRKSVLAQAVRVMPPKAG